MLFKNGKVSVSSVQPIVYVCLSGIVNGNAINIF